ncbi:MAG: S1 RNA-binding domain-containing protein, partial [Sedimentisphaerales bacterium]
GQEIKCVVLEVNEEKRRVSLGIKQITEDPWIRAIPEKYIPGHIIRGRVAKLTNFGAFVELEPDLEGLLHISELADHKIDKPQDIVKVGDEVEVKILKVDTDSRKIGLSLRRVQWAAEEQAAESAKQRAPAGPERVLSDADVDRLAKPKEKTNPGKDTDAKPSEVDKKEVEATKTEAGNAVEAKVAGNPILRVFKRKKDVRSEDQKSAARQKPEQAHIAPQESTDARSQAGDDSSPKEKTEEK